MRDWLLAPLFGFLLLANAASTYLFMMAQAISYGRSFELDVTMIAAWVVLVLAACWTKGNVLVRLLLFAAPTFVIIGMLAYTTFIDGNV